MHNLWGVIIFFKNHFLLRMFFLIGAINLTTQGPLYTCLVILCNRCVGKSEGRSYQGMKHLAIPRNITSISCIKDSSSFWGPVYPKTHVRDPSDSLSVVHL